MPLPAIELEDPLRDVVEEVAVVRDGDDGARERLRGAARATRRSRRRGGSSARRAAACRAARAAPGITRRGASRRRRAFVTSASAGGRRSASIAISILLSRFQRSSVSICSCTRRLLVEQLLHRLVVIGSANAIDDLVELDRAARAARLHRELDVAAHVERSGRAAAPAAGSRSWCPCAAHASPWKSWSMPAMMRSSDDFPAPLAPSTPIFAPG